MALPAPLAAVAGQVTSSARSVGQLAMLYVLIGLLALVGAGFLVAALYIAIASATDPLIAALVVGAGFIALAGIILAVVIAKAEKRKEEQRRAAANAAMMASTMTLANTGLRLASRATGPMFWPALGIVAAGIYFSRRRS